MNKRYYEHTLSTTREFIEYLRHKIHEFIKTDIFVVLYKADKQLIAK